MPFMIDETPYDQWLPEIHKDIILFSDEAVASSFNSTQYKNIESFKNYNTNGNIHKLALDYHYEEPFQRILGLDEFDLIRLAHLREYLNIPGQGLLSATTYRDKLLMKKHLDYHNIAIPEYRELKSPIDLIEFIEEYKYPVIVKPRNLVSSMGIVLIRSESDLQKFLENDFEKNMMVENYIEAKLYHIDGLVKDGELMFVWPSAYLSLNRCWLNDGFTSSYMLEPKNPTFNKLIDYTKKVLKAMPSPDIFTFHLEVFEENNGKLLVCEITSRTGLGRVNKMLEECCSINLNRSVLRLQCGLEENVKPKLNNLGGWILCPPKWGKLVKIPTNIPFDYIKDYQIHGQIGDSYTGGDFSGDKIASMILVGKDEVELRKNMNEAYKWFEEHTIWSKDYTTSTDLTKFPLFKV